MAASPQYPERHSGPVLVCGSAECLPADLDKARSRWPDAPVIAVNGVAGHVEAFALFSQHSLKLKGWRALHSRAYPDLSFTTHSAGKGHLTTQFGGNPLMPWVDHWWDDSASGATSAWGARKMARSMGFDLVILCGAPLEPQPYFDGTKIAGNRRWRSRGVARHYQKNLLEDVAWHSGACSMSGWTRELLGDGS